jgi:hypothetical protein
MSHSLSHCPIHGLILDVPLRNGQKGCIDCVFTGHSSQDISPSVLRARYGKDMSQTDLNETMYMTRYRRIDTILSDIAKEYSDNVERAIEVATKPIRDRPTRFTATFVYRRVGEKLAKVFEEKTGLSKLVYTTCGHCSKGPLIARSTDKEAIDHRPTDKEAIDHRPTDKKIIIHRSTDKGKIDSPPDYTIVCTKCNKLTCPSCYEPIGAAAAHVCNVGTVASIKEMRRIKKCPKCRIPYIRYTGCSNMYCTECRNSFQDIENVDTEKDTNIDILGYISTYIVGVSPIAEETLVKIPPSFSSSISDLIPSSNVESHLDMFVKHARDQVKRLIGKKCHLYRKYMIHSAIQPYGYVISTMPAKSESLQKLLKDVTTSVFRDPTGSYADKKIDGRISTNATTIVLLHELITRAERVKKNVEHVELYEMKVLLEGWNIIRGYNIALKSIYSGKERDDIPILLPSGNVEYIPTKLPSIEHIVDRLSEVVRTTDCAEIDSDFEHKLDVSISRDELELIYKYLERCLDLLRYMSMTACEKGFWRDSLSHTYLHGGNELREIIDSTIHDLRTGHIHKHMDKVYISRKSIGVLVRLRDDPIPIELDVFPTMKQLVRLESDIEERENELYREEGERPISR